MKHKLLFFLSCFVLSLSIFGQEIYYVKPNGTGNGTSWQNASGDLQLIIDNASALDQIWVAEGTYTTTISFKMKEQVNVFGGFTGDETLLEERDWFNNVTILDGTNSCLVLDQTGQFGFENETIWDGFTITNGNSSPTQDGGGVRLLKNGTILNSKIIGNTAVNFGGGVYCKKGSLVKNCIISENIALTGGGVFCANGGRVINCDISYNNGSYGGGIVSYGGGEVINCAIYHNQGDRGGGVYQGGGGSIINCMIASNHASEYGGGIWSAFEEYGGYPGLVSNTIIWNNTTDGTDPQVSFEMVNSFAIVKYSHCGIQDSQNLDWGFVEHSKIINLNPINDNPNGPNFSNPVENDYTLTSLSPCINIGDNSYIFNCTEDIALNIRIQNGRVDLGCFETVFGESQTSFDRYYVKPTGNDISNGSSWDNAMQTIQAAINVAAESILPGQKKEIWIAQGVYTLTSQIEFKQGVDIFGGFNGTELNLEERDYINNITTLDANAGGNLRRGVFQSIGFEVSTSLDGFKVINGNVPGKGGGILLREGGIVSNCIISNNFAGWFGGGVYLYDEAFVNNCTIKNNGSDSGGGAYFAMGGQIDQSYFLDNNSWSGGGAFTYESGRISNSLFKGNTTTYAGGGITSYLGGEVVNCTLIDNIANDTGGGINLEHQDNWGSDPILLANCILWNNLAQSSNNQLNSNGNTNIIVKNNAIEDLFGISWGQEIHDANINLTIDNEVNGGPNFIDPDNNDFSLTSLSPCIESGKSELCNELNDLAGEIRIQGTAIDMGALESPFVVGNSYQNIFSEQLRVYPNPSNGELYIVSSNINGPVDISIISSLGRVVYRNKTIISTGSELRIDLSGIGNGIYLFFVKGNMYSHSERLIIN